ncbi:hypothetical protein FQA39_LY01688 [Lamprigera yunnana]|nr:hypothetical protein FQA39_LY01688 [Lamprigera yunnana]
MRDVPVGFGVLDYIIFSAILIISTLIGVYLLFFGEKQSKDLYLLGGRQMKPIPVALSLIASKVSAILLIAIPTDVYRYGSDLVCMMVCVVIAVVLNRIVFLPIFFELQITSMYEYLNLRFNKSVQVFGSFLFTLSIFLFNPLVLYLPSLAFAQGTENKNKFDYVKKQILVSGMEINTVIPIVCAVCIFYTTIGGMTAVVMADVFQVICILICVTVYFVLGLMSVGGITDVVKHSVAGERLSLEFGWDPTLRVSVWSMLIGGSFHNLPLFALHQDLVQKYLSLPQLSACTKTSIVYCIGFNILFAMSILMGNIIYTRYRNCDPLTAKEITNPDEIVPYFIRDIAGHIPGFPGIFIGGLFSAALSTLAGHLNTIAATVYEDMISNFVQEDISTVKINLILKCIVIVTGLCSTGLIYAYEYVEGAFTVMVIIQGTVNGPLVALFICGMFFPEINAKGALIGSIVGLIFSTWLAIGNFIYRSRGLIVYRPKPVSVEQCFPPVNVTLQQKPSYQPFYMYRLSTWYYLLMCLIISLTTARFISYLTTKDKPVSKNLLSRCVHYTPPEPEST